LLCFYCVRVHRALHSFPTRRSSDLVVVVHFCYVVAGGLVQPSVETVPEGPGLRAGDDVDGVGEVAGGFAKLVEVESGVVMEDERSEEHTSELQSRENLVCRLLLEKK